MTGAPAVSPRLGPVAAPGKTASMSWLSKRDECEVDARSVSQSPSPTDRPGSGRPSRSRECASPCVSAQVTVGARRLSSSSQNNRYEPMTASG